jgi:hypothetical protein
MKSSHVPMYDDNRTMQKAFNQMKSITDQMGPALLFVTISFAEHKLEWVYD